GRHNAWEVSWSLPLEVAFYVICSVLFACRLLHRIGAKTFAVLLILFALACTAKLLRTKNPTDDVYHWMIVLSAPLGLLASRYVAGRVSRRAFYGLLAGVCGTLFYVWCLNHLLYPSVATYGQLVRSVVIGAAGYGAFVALLERRDRRLPRVGCWFGQRSYPIYLLHP